MQKLACFRGVPTVLLTEKTPAEIALDPDVVADIKWLEPGLAAQRVTSVGDWDRARTVAAVPWMARFKEWQALDDRRRARIPPHTAVDRPAEYAAEELRAGNECTLHDFRQVYGGFHPRIWRAGARVARYEEKGVYASEREEYARENESYFVKHHAAMLQASHVASLHLYDQFAALLRVIEPDKRNDDAFGHALRQLLILVSTEVEAGWRAVLEENGYPGQRWSTKDYVKLAAPMRLAEWSVQLEAYPQYGSVQPFAGWSAVPANPTAALPWYDAYNTVKHDREDLHLATLGRTIEAMAALTIINWAQFGERLVGIESVPRTAVFAAQGRPTWLPEEWYVGPNLDTDPGWHPVQLPL